MRRQTPCFDSEVAQLFPKGSSRYGAYILSLRAFWIHLHKAALEVRVVDRVEHPPVGRGALGPAGSDGGN